MMVGIRIFLTLAAITTVLCGCTVVNRLPPRPVSHDIDDVAEVTQTAVVRLLGTLREPLDPSRPILVATLADVSKLDESSPLGRMISEQIASNLVQQGYVVPEIKLRHGMLVEQGGEFILSRDLSVLAPRQGAQAIVTGTYAAGDRDALISLRVLRLNDSRIIAAYDYEMPLGENSLSLLRSAAR